MTTARRIAFDNTEDVHIVSGEAAAGSFKVAHGSPRSLLVFRDLLCSGPVADFASVDEFKRTRSAHLASLWPSLEQDVYRKKEDLLYDEVRLKGDGNIYIWAGTGLEDLLLILLVVHLVELFSRRFDRIRLIRYTPGAAGQKTTHSIGQLAPELLERPPTPTHLDHDHTNYYLEAWKAFTSASPPTLDRFLNTPKVVDVYCARALRFMVHRYPQRSTGLNDWERRLLRSVDLQSRSVAELVRRALSSELQGDAVRDLLLYNTLLDMSAPRAERPLITMSASGRDLMDAHVSITAFGREVVSGKASSFPVNSYDRWIGGVHLSSRTGHMWFRENEHLVP